MKGLILCFLIFLTVLSHAQVKVNTVGFFWTHEPCKDSCDIYYPFIEHKDPLVANNINQILAEHYGDTDPSGNTPKSIFTPNLQDDSDYYWGGLGFLEYEVTANTSNYASFSFRGEGEGAHPTPFTAYYVFDLYTGFKIDFIQLFTMPYYLKLTKILEKAKADSVKANEIFWAKEYGEEDDNSDMIFATDTDWMHMNCEPYDFYIDQNNFYMVDDPLNFFPHVILAGMPPFDPIKIPLASIKPNLSDYGKYIFGLNKKWVMPLEQIQFRGAIGKYDIKIVLAVNTNKWMNKQGQKIEGYYFYESTGKPLYAKGNTDGKTLHLDVYNENFKLFEKFDGDIYHVNGTDMDEPLAPAVISGKWTNLQSNQKLVFYVKESDY